MSDAKIKIVCSHCGSDDVRRDAYAEWNVDAQTWELGTVFDQGYCEACGGEASLDEEEISETCQHAEHEECMFCTQCGECSETLDDEDICDECRGKENAA
jgi:hypothetical protein